MAGVAAGGGWIRVVYLTDGSRSHPASTTFPPRRIAAIRKREARKALRALGIGQAPAFMGICDGRLARAPRRAVVANLARIVRSARPDAILAPWRRDPHPDHAAAGEIALAAWCRTRSPAALGFYEVWLPFSQAPSDRPHAWEALVADERLSDTARYRKRRALEAHRSQHGLVVDDDPSGFTISSEHLRAWHSGRERIFWHRSYTVR